ncbi:MAG: hypothetical protein WC763_06125 [Candidatus Paceibacterota bacterium]|jgi:hypothetical protein
MDSDTRKALKRAWSLIEDAVDTLASAQDKMDDVGRDDLEERLSDLITDIRAFAAELEAETDDTNDSDD